MQDPIDANMLYYTRQLLNPLVTVKVVQSRVYCHKWELGTVHCALYKEQCNVLCIVYNVYCTVNTVYCKMYSVQCTAVLCQESLLFTYCRHRREFWVMLDCRKLKLTVRSQILSD